MDLITAAHLIKALKALPNSAAARPTFMEIAGYPHYENVCSNILAFYLDPYQPHGLGTLCLSALLELAIGNIPHLSNLKVEREVSTANGNRLDLLISSDTHLILIENKIFAALTNPFSDYANDLTKRASQPNREIIKVILGFNNYSTVGFGFLDVSYDNFISAIRSRLGYQIKTADTQYLIQFNDFLNNLENLRRGSVMDSEWLDFFRNHDADLKQLLKQMKALQDELRRKVVSLSSEIDTANKSFIKQWMYREPGGIFDTLVHDVKISNMTVALDAIISPQGWEVQIFTRAKRDMEQLCDLLRSLQIPFERNERLIFPTRFSYNENNEIVSEVLRNLINKLSVVAEA